ncbi:MAG: Wzt carbohydrate-binding domain-containing protein, partial [Solirubrobacteraceae bacterium]
THDMATVQAFCDRAMLIHDGEQRYIGDPEEAALRYYRLNFAGGHDPGGADGSGPDVELVDVWLEDLSGRRLTDLEHGQSFSFNALVRARRDFPAPALAFELLNVDNVSVLGFGEAITTDDGAPRPVGSGERIRLSVQLDCALVPGRYSVLGSMSRSHDPGDDAMRDLRVLEFLVKGSEPLPGMISVRAAVHASVEVRAA